MDRKKRALVFEQDVEGGSPLLQGILRDLKITSLQPDGISSDPSSIGVIIIERPADNAAKILNNLRSYQEFADLPSLVILEPAELLQAQLLKKYNADVLFKPLVREKIKQYLENLNGRAPASGANPVLNKTTKASKPTIQPSAPTAAKGGFSSTEDKKTVVLDRKAAEEKTVLPTRPTKAPKPLLDIIPESPRLLSSVPLTSEASKGSILCAQCHSWKVRKEDAFCSRCGATLITLEVQVEEVIFEPLGEHRVGALIDLRNAGQNPLQIIFSVVAGPPLEGRFTLHVEQAVLEGKDVKHQRVILNTKGLDLTTSHEAILELLTNEKGLLRRKLKLVVERLPSPRVAVDSPDPYIFAMGGENDWNFRLANDGGGTIKLKSVRLDVSKDLLSGVALELPEPVVVRSAQVTGVRLRLPALDLTVGSHTLTTHWEIDGFSPIVLDVRVIAKRPPRLTVRPLTLDFGVVSTKRTKTLDVALSNDGGEDLIIESIKPSDFWLEFKTKTPLPMHIKSGGREVLELKAHGPAVIEDGEKPGEVVIRSDSFQNPAQVISVAVKFKTPEEYDQYIGIDFGTTASCVAVLKDSVPVLLPIEQFNSDPRQKVDSRLMPSVLFFHEDGSVLAGREAQVYASGRPDRAVTSIKRSLGLKQKKIIGDKEYDSITLTSQIIERLLERSEDGLYELGEYKTPHQAVLTVPIEFIDSQRRALLEACTHAGLNTQVTNKHGIVIDEAQAAALYYLSIKDPGSATSDVETVLIFDWGGGTLDCALARIEIADGKPKMRTLALDGDPHLGGEDIDWALVGLLADKAKEAYPDFDKNCLGSESKFEHHYRLGELWSAAHKSRAQFKRQAELAKINLITARTVSLSITPLLRVNATPLDLYVKKDLNDAVFEVELTESDLELALKPFLDRAKDKVESLCEKGNILLEEVDTILHTGRTSYLPMVRETINEMLSEAEEPSVSIEPKACVAMGAAIWGHFRELADADFQFIGPANRSIHAIGYNSGSNIIGGLRGRFEPVFPAQTEFPCEKILEFPRKDVIKLDLYENRGKNTDIAGNPDINPIGTVKINTQGLTEPRVPVRFILNENRLLEIIANDRRQLVELG